VLGEALSAAGLVNHPTEWWHWSYGDRYWALETGAPAALYGAKELDAAWRLAAGRGSPERPEDLGASPLTHRSLSGRGARG
jgi:D-ala-D-ala dipeptidase